MTASGGVKKSRRENNQAARPGGRRKPDGSTFRLRLALGELVREP